MAIVRREPSRELAAIQHQLDRMFSHTFPRAFAGFRGPSGEEPGLGTWAPAVDIFETDQNVVLKAELAGVDPKGVEVRVENNTLYFKGQKKVDTEVKEENYHRIERSFGSLARSFALPDSVDADKVAAEYQNGILTLTVPKKEKAKSKAISIKVAGN